MAEEDAVDDIMYDIGRMAEMSAFLDHEIQRFVLLVREVPDAEAKSLLFQAFGPKPPEFLEMAENFRRFGLGFMRLNESIDTLLKEGLAKAAAKAATRAQDEKPPEAPLTPSQIDPVLAEGLRNHKDDNGPDR